jgi:hypothetical protein
MRFYAELIRTEDDLIYAHIDIQNDDDDIHNHVIKWKSQFQYPHNL